MKAVLRGYLTNFRLYFTFRAIWKVISFDRKTWLGCQYLYGQGLEIGALNAPLVVLPWVKVKYLDRLTVSQLRQQYPELASYPLSPVDILDNGETLKTLKKNSLDFLIAHHFLEHCQDPLGTMVNHLRVLKPGGILYLAIPDKNHNVDSLIPPTSLNHLIADHQDPKHSYQKHIYNWAYYVDKKRGQALSNHINHLININYSIHFHQWTRKELKELLDYLQKKKHLPFVTKEFIFNQKEYLLILKKL